MLSGDPSTILHKIYFVRHAQSTENQTRTHGDFNAPLSELGRQQAREVAERFTRIEIDLVVTSHMQRARETGEIIASVIQKPTQESSLFQELIKPKEMIGMEYDDPKFDELVRSWHEHWSLDETWRYSTEETFQEVKERALQARYYLEALSERNIVVVTHGLFSKAFITSLIFGQSMSWNTFHRFDRALISKNTGITYFEHRERKHPQLSRFILHEDTVQDPDHHGWYLMAWNDHAHLG